LDKCVHKLAVHSVFTKTLFLRTHKRTVDWYCKDYCYQCLKYVLYYESFKKEVLSTRYNLILVDIVESDFTQLQICIPTICGGRILLYFREEILDTRNRQAMLESPLYVYTQIDRHIHAVQVVRKIAEETGILVSPRFIYYLRKDAEKTKVSF
jgi:hypothetical protein